MIRKLILIVSAACASFCLASVASAKEPMNGSGIHSWAGWQSGQISREECPELRGVPIILKWHSLEPKPGDYRFEEAFGARLREAFKQDLYVTVMIWVGPAGPQWLYEKGVPKVYSDRDVNPLGEKMSKKQNTFPYYFSPIYKDGFFALIDAFGEYVNALAPELRERIVFVQSAEGSTGDGQPYKGNPIDPKYAISKADWNDFRNETWKRYMKQLTGIPVLVNSDANESKESEWILDNMSVIALKHGMFSHGFHVSDNQARLEKYHTLKAKAEKRGKSMLTRGEMDAELFVMGWSKRNIPQALYWSGLFATHCELDIWNVPHMALKEKSNLPAFEFFNKYAGQRNPLSGPAAFCALRDGLDAADFERFPASQFGGRPGSKRDAERYIRIANAFSAYGARMDDAEKAVGGGMVNRKRSGSNDAGWGILPGNYSRFLEQIEPGAGDVAWWNIDDTIYGRFARGFEHESSKAQLRFALDETFSKQLEKANGTIVNVTYLDKGKGTWLLRYADKNGSSRSIGIRNMNSGDWKVESIRLGNAVFRGLLDGADIVLEYESGDDTIFHMVEIEQTK